MNNLTGGLYISQGSNGCVYRPSFAGNKYPSNDKLISKIIEKGSINNELENVSKLELEKLDKAHNFLLLPKDIDNFKDDSITLDTLADCPLITKAIHKDEDIVLFLNKNYDNLIADYGGKSLNLYRNDSVNVFEDKMVDYLNLMMGILLMNSNGIIHRDIKHSHITTEPIMKIIDFGLATNNYDFSSATHSISKNTPYWPLEYHLLQSDFYNKHSKIVDNSTQKVDKVIYCINLVDTLIRDNYINNINGTLFTPSELGTFYDKYIQIAVSIFISKDIDIDVLRTICLDKFDIFSLGVVLVNELKITSRDSKLHKDIISEINYIFNNMIYPNPISRPNIIDVITEYLYILYSNELIDNDFYNETIKKIRDISGFNILNFGELQDILIN